MTVEEVRSIINEHCFYIYGGGYAASILCEYLEKDDLFGNFVGFITRGGGEIIRGIRSISLKSLVQKDEYVLVAVHDTLWREVSVELQKAGITNYIWIYPYLLNLKYGNPVENGRYVSLQDIWKANSNRYDIVIRFLAVDEYYGFNSFGYELYYWFISQFSNCNTAKKRLEKFIQLIESIESKGIEEEYPICLLKDYSIIDGAHRYAIALYRGERQMKCNIYAGWVTDVQELTYIDEQRIREFSNDKHVLRVISETYERIDQGIYSR